MEKVEFKALREYLFEEAKNKLSTFTVKIDDTFVEVEFEFVLSSNTCIEDIVGAIEKHFNTERRSSKVVKNQI